MSSNERSNHTLREPSMVASLDEDIARLTLDSSGGKSTNPSEKFSGPQPLAVNTGDGAMAINTSSRPLHTAPAPDESRDSRQQRASAKRRPNQAQRRQMSSQFSIPVDTRPVQSSSSWQGSHPGPNHSGHYMPPPRHQHTLSYPQPNTGAFISQQQSYGPWNARGNGSPHNGYGYIDHQSQSHPRIPPQSHPHRNSNMFRYQHGESPDVLMRQSLLLDNLCLQTIASSEISRPELAEKDTFRLRIESICRQVIAEYECNATPNFPKESVRLACFGSLASGFATKAADMDLGLLSPYSVVQPGASGSPIPRLLEKAFLDHGIGARLLSRTRVPIIKLCESPPENLLKGLLLQRAKWEAGLGQDQNDAHSEHEQAGDETTDAKEEECMPQPEAEHNTPDFTTFQVPDKQGKLREFHLRQKRGQDLGGYCTLAKAVLRKAGGRDLNAFNARDFLPDEWMLQSLICRAFVHGIADLSLRESLMKLPSLSFDLDLGVSRSHSLTAISIQAEGEQIIQKWQSWPLSSILVALDPACQQLIDLWRSLQLRRTSGDGLIWYAKELQQSLQNLKKTPSFQLLLFKQNQRERVSAYHQRMLEVIWVHNGSLQNDEDFQHEIIHRYISGIHSKDVRNDIKSWQSSTSTWELGFISGKHRCLQLASDLERALSENLYEAAVAVDVDRYIQVLRGPLREAHSLPLQYPTLIVPPDDGEANDLLPRIISIPDPHGVPSGPIHEKYRDPLEFPKCDVGVQCDINFSAHLALENTALLRCYSCTDRRVRPMVLFVKHWAKVRGINSPYRGTLSSYGYVLMVLHYLVNVASPFVCPNLQQIAAENRPAEEHLCKGYSVNFWRDEATIADLASQNRLNQNTQTIGYLLRGFFEYFAQRGPLTNLPRGGFDWGREVLSLRCPGGLLTKQEKGWTGAKSVYQALDPNEPSATPPTDATDDTSGGVASGQAGTASKSAPVKEVRLRYLFAIEDPFEIDHNVARTVTHDGIVSIRDEFRRAWSIIQLAGRGRPHDDLLEDPNHRQDESFVQTLYEIHNLPLAETDKR